MNGLDPQEVAEWIVDQCDADPPQNVPDNERMFSDLEDDRMSDALFKLWQKGVLEAHWDEEAGETAWNLTHFGVELNEKGLTRAYVMALEDEIHVEASPDVLEAPQ